MVKHLAITFKLTAEQKEEILKVAKRKGLNLASFCRFVILNEVRKSNEKDN